MSHRILSLCVVSSWLICGLLSSLFFLTCTPVLSAPKKSSEPRAKLLLRENAVGDPSQYRKQLALYEEWAKLHNGPNLAHYAEKGLTQKGDQELLDYLQYLWNNERPKSWASNFLSAVRDGYPAFKDG